MGQVAGKLSTTFQTTLLSKQALPGGKEARRQSRDRPCSAKACGPNKHPPLWFGDTDESGWEWVSRWPYSCTGTCPMALSSLWYCPVPVCIDLPTVCHKVGNSRCFMLF